MQNSVISKLRTVSDSVLQERQTDKGSGSASAFSNALGKAISEVNNLHQNADKAIMDVQSGNAGNLHEAIIALEKADVSFRTMLTIRNKIIESYQEIMRMQV